MGVAYDDYSFAEEESEVVYLSTAESGKTLVRRGDIPQIIEDPFIRDALSEWSKYRRFGLAHGAGWKNERLLYIRVLECCEQEYQHATATMREENRGK